MRLPLLVLILALCLPPRPPPDLVVFGDSIALGLRSGSDTPSYAVQLAADQGMALDNRAVSGTVVSQTLALVRAYQGPSQDAAWLVCANDLFLRTPAEDFARDVQAGVDTLRARGMRVYLNRECPPFPRREEPGLVSAYNAALAGITGALPVDVSGMPPGLFHDGTHPNAAGHAWLALRYAQATRRRAWIPLLR